MLLNSLTNAGFHERKLLVFAHFTRYLFAVSWPLDFRPGCFHGYFSVPFFLYCKVSRGSGGWNKGVLVASTQL